jgi:predicted DNA-binding antitoxin AbrB/MazE fold protein
VARLDGLRALDLVQKGKTKAVSIALTGKILLYGREHEYHLMAVKARYEDNVLKPLEKLDLADGEMVEIEIIKSNADRLIGLLKDIDVDSVDLQHAARDIWVRKVVSD